MLLKSQYNVQNHKFQIINKAYELVFREYLKSTYFRNGAWNTNKQMKTMLERMKHQKNVASEMIEKINIELNK